MRTVARWLLAGAMIFAGIGHLSFARRGFQAQVPDFAAKALGKDGVVVASGAVEIMFGAALLVLPHSRERIGALLALFFVAIFPGNLEQYAKRRSAFGLDTDRRRLVRLFFQPGLVAWAWWSTRKG